MFLPKYPSLLSLLHFDQLVSFLEDTNSAIMFSYFKGSSQPTESLGAIYHVATILQNRNSLEILSSHSLQLSFWLSLRQRNISTRPKSFFNIHIFSHPNIIILGWESICMVKKLFSLLLMFPVNINVNILFLFSKIPSPKIHTLKWIWESSYQKIMLELVFRFLTQEHFLNLKRCSLI